MKPSSRSLALKPGEVGLLGASVDIPGPIRTSPVTCHVGAPFAPAHIRRARRLPNGTLLRQSYEHRQKAFHQSVSHLRTPDRVSSGGKNLRASRGRCRAGGSPPGEKKPDSVSQRRALNRDRKNPFKDAIVIVTGSGSGIGRGICEELGRRGARVVVTGRNVEGVETVASGIVAAGGRAEAVRVDVSREEEVQKVIDDTVASHGRLDYMFNNAGIAMRCEVQDMTIAHWHRIVDVNLMGMIYGTNAAYAQMVRQGGGAHR
jgi:hypothetical protein